LIDEVEAYSRPL